MNQPDPIKNDNPAIVDLVVKDLKERKELGLQRYGVALQAHNGRNALQDLYEELQDAVIYLRQVIEEQKTKPVAGQVQVVAADPQELIFELIKLGSFNGFDGPHCVELLKQHRDLWDAVNMDSDGDEYLLRDLPDDYHVDTMYIRVAEGKEKELMKLVKEEFGADEVDWKDTRKDWQGRSLEKQTLRVWWD